MSRSLRRKAIALATVVPAVAGAVVLTGAAAPGLGVTELVSSVTASDGTVVSVTNHLVDLPGVPTALPSDEDGDTHAAAEAGHGEYMLVWAGDENAADLQTGYGTELGNLPGKIGQELGETGPRPQSPLPGPDFLAVIDTDPESANYGKVVNTVTISPVVENEPHHMQYVWHKGHKVFAGGLFSDFTYVFDVSKLPAVTISGVNSPVDTPCGSVPDAFWVLNDGTAYGTWMGGANLPGPCTYTNGTVLPNNGFAGAPGSLVRLGEDGKTLSESPAWDGEAEFPDCANYTPVGPPTCANPHGIQLREDLNRMITTDFAEPRWVVEDPLPSGALGDVNIYRRTVRIWDITDRANPKVVSVARMPDGPRATIPSHKENVGMMEGTVTNLPKHKGAFAESMCGAAIFYTPDMTAENPEWREVYSHTDAYREIDPFRAEYGNGSCDGGGWVQTSLDDRYLYHVVMGRRPNTNGPGDPGTPGMLYALDIQKLLAAGNDYKCNIDTMVEDKEGGSEPDCPTLKSVLPVDDATSGGPHWGALDNFAKNDDGTWSETTNVRRISYANYFVARAGWDGNHKVCMVNIGDGHQFSLDTEFKDEVTGQPCVDFNRASWPHGPFGNAKPHSNLFVVPDAGIR